MCGILGMVSQAPITDTSWLKSGADVIAHRGPDDSGHWISDCGHVAIAHRRLSIVDLSAAGHQPMYDAYTRLIIVFNGEIYNFHDLRNELAQKGHSFKSNSDTEMILKAYKEWGTDCIKRFNGMFVFALYDMDKEQVFFARDRAGEKPLFLYQAGTELRFASEMKALLADRSLKRELDMEMLDSYLTIGYVPGHHCILKGFSKLKAAHAMVVDVRTGNVTNWCYWQLPDSPAENPAVSEAALQEELHELLSDSVKRQLIADVPVGVLLSGGLDSSIITSLAVKYAPNVKTFTIGFPGFGSIDETQHARLIAKHFGTEHIELVAEPATADLIPKLAQQFDEPMADSSMIPTYLVSQLVAQHCKVALGGDGGDELFGGYEHYSRLLKMNNKLGSIPLPLRKMIAAMAERALPSGVKGRNWLQALGTDLNKEVPLIGYFFDPVMRRKLLAGTGREYLGAAGDLMIKTMTSGKKGDIVQRATRMDFQNYLVEDILVKVDRASMLNSLELRAPMLDYRIIEFAFGKIPSSLKATQSEKKILLKKLALRIMPKGFDLKRKQGFSIPLSTWLQAGPFRELFWEVLTDPGCLLNQSATRSLLEGQDKGRNNSERLFALVLFEFWRKQYAVKL